MDRIPTLKPSWDEFKDMNAYIADIEKRGLHHLGLVKVIPPDGWSPHGKDDYDWDSIYKMKIPRPTMQDVRFVQDGVYQQYNVPHRPLSVAHYRDLCNLDQYSTPHHTTDADLDDTFLKTILNKPAAVYGSGVEGTLFSDTVTSWNVSRIGSILDHVTHDYKTSYSGINTSWLYFGMWKTLFAWHSEDMDLYSVNYHQFGAPKRWYCVPASSAHLFEAYADKLFPNEVKNCKAHLRHKTTFISPEELCKNGIPCYEITQKRGEFMVTFPLAYHAGINHGFNCAEASNSASPNWIELDTGST